MKGPSGRKTQGFSPGSIHCGHEHDDADLRTSGCMEGDQICDKCDKEFKFTSDFTVHWTTEIFE